MGPRRPARSSRSMAGLTALRIQPTRRTAMPADAAIVVEPPAPGIDPPAAPVGKPRARAGIVGTVLWSGGAAVVEVVVDGWRFELDVEPAARAALRQRARRIDPAGTGDAAHEVRAMIPGRIVSVAVGLGDPVHAGQPLFVLEAMKMQNEIRAPRAGIVARVAVEPGRTVELGDVLLLLE